MEIPNIEELIVNINFKERIEELKAMGEEGKAQAKQLVQEAKEELKESIKNFKEDVSNDLDNIKFKGEQFVQAIPACAIEIGSIPAAVGTPFTLSTAPTFINNGIKSIGTLQSSFKDFRASFTNLTTKLESVGITSDLIPEPVKTVYDGIKKVLDALETQIPSVPEIATLTIDKIEIRIVDAEGEMQKKSISSGIPKLYMAGNGTDSYTFEIDSILNTINTVISVFIKDVEYTGESSWEVELFTVKFGEEKSVPNLWIKYKI